MAISTSLLVKTPGWKILSYRIQPILSMIGMKEYPKNATKPMLPLVFWIKKDILSKLPIITIRLVLILVQPCLPG